jgi:hypothetical protein
MTHKLPEQANSLISFAGKGRTLRWNRCLPCRSPVQGVAVPLASYWSVSCFDDSPNFVLISLNTSVANMNAARPPLLAWRIC